MDPNIASAVHRATVTGLLKTGRPYSRSEILGAFMRACEIERATAERLFAGFRAGVASGATFAGIGVATQGVKRGRKYVLSGTPEG
ncbi:hypothetical protein ACFL59_10590 [Planctomycetota bacterium]